MPLLPTLRSPLLVQVGPGPLTVTVPVLPVSSPMKPEPLVPEPLVPEPLETVPPLWIVSVPVPLSPTLSAPLLVQVEQGPLTSTVPVLPLPM